MRSTEEGEREALSQARSWLSDTAAPASRASVFHAASSVVKGSASTVMPVAVQCFVIATTDSLSSRQSEPLLRNARDKCVRITEWSEDMRNTGSSGAFDELAEHPIVAEPPRSYCGFSCVL